MELSVVEKAMRSKKFIVRYNILLPDNEYSVNHVTSGGDIAILNYRQATDSAYYLLGVSNTANIEIREESDNGIDIDYNVVSIYKVTDISTRTEHVPA